VCASTPSWKGVNENKGLKCVCIYPKLTRCEQKLGAKMRVHIPQADKVCAKSGGLKCVCIYPKLTRCERKLGAKVCVQGPIRYEMRHVVCALIFGMHS